MANISNINDFFIVDSVGLKAVVGADLANGNGSPYVGTDFTVVGRDASSPVANLWLSNFTHKSYILISDNSSNFIIRDSGAGNRLTIDSSGNSTFAGSVTAPSILASGFMEIRSDTASLYFENAANNNYYRLKRSSNDFVIDYYNGSTTADRLVIDSSGNVGIGVTPEAWSGYYPVLQIGDRGSIAHWANDSISIGDNWYYASGNKRIEAGYAPRIQLASATGKIYFDIADTDAADSAITWSTKMIILPDGNVGIGTTSPDAKLEVANSATGVPVVRLSGFASANSTAYSKLEFYNEDGSGQGPNIASSIKALTGTNSNGSGGALSFSTSTGTGVNGSEAEERMLIDPNGMTTIRTNGAGASLTIGQGGSISINENVGYLNFYSNDVSTTSSGGVGGIGVYGETAFSTSYTPTYMSFFTHAETANDGTVEGNVTERMRITSAGVVEIKNTGAAHLILNGDTNNSGDAGEEDSIIDFRGDGNPGLYGYRINTENWSGQTALNFQEYINGSYTSRLFISKDGDVGIGATSPQGKLDSVAPAADLTDFGRATGSALNIRIANVVGHLGQINFCNDAAPAFGYGSIGMVMTSGSGVGLGDMVFGTKDLGSAVVSTERMRIDSSGQITNTMSGGKVLTDTNGFITSFQTLDVATAGGRYKGKSNRGLLGQLRIEQTATGADGGYITLDTSASGSTSPTERMRITSGGHILLGNTTASLTSDPGFKYIDDANVPYFGEVVNTSTGNGYSSFHHYNTNATFGGFRFYILNNGGIVNYSSNNVNLSDERVKHNIESSGNYLDKICSIPVRLFNYKDEPEGTDKNLGVIAQEVEAIAPELVNNDGFGETPEDGIPLKTVYSTDMMYALMKAIQELKAEIEILKNK